MSFYDVPLDNLISGRSGRARVTAQGPAAPVVTGVEVRARSVVGTYEEVTVVVQFDPSTLVGGPPLFGFEVSVGAGPQGPGVMDGHDSMTGFGDIEADYAIDGETTPRRWQSVTDLEVRVQVEPKP